MLRHFFRRWRKPQNTYNITVNVPPGMSKADIGRQIVEVIRRYEGGSGSGVRR